MDYCDAGSEGVMDLDEWIEQELEIIKKKFETIDKTDTVWYGYWRGRRDAVEFLRTEVTER